MSRYKFIAVFMSLIFISGQVAYADIISVPDFSADSSVAHMNTFKNTVVNNDNGNISGGAGTGATINIKADSIAEIDMADDANPRVRDSYLLGITVDTISGGVAASQGAFVKSGGVPATDSDLTSDVSAVIAFVNGYYISKAATAQTYADGTTTYLWLNQSSSYVQSTNPNTNVSNAALIASVVTSGGQITTVTDLANRRLPGLLVPSNYRTGVLVSRDSASTITVFPGSAEINNTTLSKVSVTTLNIATAGDWAGGVSLRAASTMAFVGIDASGNLKLHTTAPTHSNYALSVTTGKKRYASWSSTTYRILGWFYMNPAQNIYISELGNIREGDVSNTVISVDATIASFTSTTLLAVSEINYYSSGGQVTVISALSGDTAAGQNFGRGTQIFFDNSAAIADSGNSFFSISDSAISATHPYLYTPSQATHKIQSQIRINTGTYDLRNRKLIIRED